MSTEEERLCSVHDNFEYSTDKQFSIMDEAVCDVFKETTKLREENVHLAKESARKDVRNRELADALTALMKETNRAARDLNPINVLDSADSLRYLVEGARARIFIALAASRKDLAYAAQAEQEGGGSDG